MNWKEYPKNWEIVRLEKVLDRLSNGLAKSQNKESHGIPVTRIETIKDEIVDSERVGYLEDASESDFRKFSLEVGDILFSHINSESHIGKTAIYEGYPKVLLHGMNLLLLRVKKSECDPFYINYLLKRYRFKNIFASIAARAVGQASINQGKMKSLEIPLPPLPEQRAIARVLRAVQAARETRLREIALERERKAALMEHLFTHGTRGEPTKMTEIGEMPESWQIVKLGNLLREQLRNGHSANASNSINGVRTLTLTAVTKNDFSVKNTKITVADRLKVKDLWIEPGDIFIERANTPEFVGLASLYEGPKDFAVFPDLMVRVRLRENDVDPKFLVEFLLTERCRNYYRRNAASTTGNMPKIDQGTIERTQIPLPKDFSEQKHIADICRACDAIISTLDHEACLLDELFRAMLEELMTGRLRAGALATP